ncbi:MAG TPA: hypothetical protein EYH05_12130 [Anaerolineae bacterium]|nr:hypothetical protein [Anaerolineae bacterium]
MKTERWLPAGTLPARCWRSIYGRVICGLSYLWSIYRGGVMTVCLLEIHIGPMQVFIAAARRTRDLWFGSWLMSELSKAAARAVADVAGEQNLIFPAASSNDLEPGSELSVANKIVATVENPQAVARQAENALRARLDELAKIALDAAGGPLDTRETPFPKSTISPNFTGRPFPCLAKKIIPTSAKKRKTCSPPAKTCGISASPPGAAIAPNHRWTVIGKASSRQMSPATRRKCTNGTKPKRASSCPA